MKVLETTKWHFGKSNCGRVSGLSGQISKCEYNGIIFYVRENITAVESFNISSGERWADKIGRQPSRYRQSLELAAPANQWNDIALLVKRNDTMQRPVLRNKTFNTKTAKKYFHELLS